MMILLGEKLEKYKGGSMCKTVWILFIFSSCGEGLRPALNGEILADEKFIKLD